MAWDPAERYQSVAEMRSDINALLSGYATIAEKATVLRNTMLFLRRNIYPVIIFLLLAVSGYLAYLAWYWYTHR